MYAVCVARCMNAHHQHRCSLLLEVQVHVSDRHIICPRIDKLTCVVQARSLLHELVHATYERFLIHRASHPLTPLSYVMEWKNVKLLCSPEAAVRVQDQLEECAP